MSLYLVPLLYTLTALFLAAPPLLLTYMAARKYGRS